MVKFISSYHCYRLLSAPGVVSSLTYSPSSSMSLYISWSQPIQSNGIITNYTITVNFENNTIGDLIVVNSTTLSVDTTTGGAQLGKCMHNLYINTSLIIDFIDPHNLYTVSVMAATSAGVGEEKNIIAFTRQGSKYCM